MAGTTLSLMGIPITGDTIGDKDVATPGTRQNMPMRSMGYVQASMRGLRSIILLLLGV